MGTYLFFKYFLPTIHPLFVQRARKKKHVFEKIIITSKSLHTQMKSRPRKHARKEGFKSIWSDGSSICHKTSSKLFLVIDILHLVHSFKVCFNHVLPLPTENPRGGTPAWK